MDLSEMSPTDRNRAVEGDLANLQDILAEAYTRVGGTPDPVAHRRELTRLEALCAVLRETSQMSGPKSSKTGALLTRNRAPANADSSAYGTGRHGHPARRG
jgi:hypothetical protein